MYGEIKRSAKWILLALVIAVSPCCSACGDDDSEFVNTGVIEPGIAEIENQENNDNEADEPELFLDKGENATLEDIDKALSNIESYYFEQTMPFIDGSVFMQIWYKDSIMKVQTSVDGVLNQVAFYDYSAMTQLSYYPGSSDKGMLMSFDPTNADAPDNPVLQDYLNCSILGYETVNRQTCMKLETPDDSILWVSTKYGFPLQVMFIDSLGEEYTVQYKNLVVNNVQSEEVAVPTDLEIVDLSGN